VGDVARRHLLREPNAPGRLRGLENDFRIGDGLVVAERSSSISSDAMEHQKSPRSQGGDRRSGRLPPLPLASRLILLQSRPDSEVLGAIAQWLVDFHVNPQTS
jgi:hypothetical protein